MALKAPSKLSTKPSRFPLLPSSITRSSKLTQTVPTTSVPKANIKVVIGVTADHTATFTRSANIGVALTVSATGLNTGGVEFGTAVVSVGITSTASANVTRSGVAAVSVGITSTCAGALTVVTHSGTADIQVNIDIVASGLGSNQIPDETSNANVMTLYGGATLTDDEAIGTRAVRLAGSGQYGIVDDTFQSTFQSPFSVSMWVKPDDGQLEAGLTERLFSTYESLQGGVALYYLECSLNEDGDIQWITTYYNGTNSSTKHRTTTSAVFADGAQSSYKHLIVTVDANGIPTIYIDGSSVALTIDDNDTFTISGYTNSGTTGTKIGAFASSIGSNHYANFNGKIDDVSIWSTALSSTDVTNLYNSGSGTSLTGSSNLEGWWKMGEGSAMPLTHMGTATISASITATATGASVAGFSNAVSLDMDGSNDIFRTRLLLNNYDGAGTSFFEDAISVSFFFRLDTVDTSATGRYFYYLDNGGNNALGCYYTPSTGKISVKFGNASYHTADLSLVADTWYHLCLSTERTTYNHSYLRYHEWELYLDGTSIKSVTGNTSVIRFDGYGVKGTLDGAVTDTDTTFTIDAANGPTSWQGTLDPRIAYIGDEQVLVSANVANAATSLSVTRAQNGTTATAHSDGAVITYSRDELTFGARYHTWPYLYYLDGQLDEIAVWNDTLTSAEVGTLKDGPLDLTSDSGNYASSANLQAWWRFEENTGTSIADSSTKSNTGTLVNGATFSSSVPS